ncbi:MAG: hypothetical protein HZA46_16720 [Planctomycetales bacterium]|nr:hypothetical protein [Planctomycetales bacterium]
MDHTCPECGAPIPAGGTCRDNFNALLLLEYDVVADLRATASGNGEVAHFYAVSSYVLQHPDQMNYTAEALAGLRQTLVDHLAGRRNLEQIRRRVRRAANGTQRITRRSSDEVIRWPVESWPMNVVDVVGCGVKGYCDRVTAWASSIVRTLDTVKAQS